MNNVFNPSFQLEGRPSWWQRTAAEIVRLLETHVLGRCVQHRMGKGETLTVQRPIQQQVICLRGSLWITHDGDPKDIVLEAGQSYRARRNDRMLVHALDEVELRVETARASASIVEPTTPALPLHTKNK